MLWIVDGARQSGFPNLRDAIEEMPGQPIDTGEDASVGIRDGTARALFLAGHQSVSREGLEVLSLGQLPGAAGEIDRRWPLRCMVEEMIGLGGPVVLPWGFGKWLGRRGAILSELLEDAAWSAHPRLFLGDIRARSWPWPAPGRIAPGLRTLPGSDPLPLPGQEDEVGRFGFELELPRPEEAPSGQLAAVLAGGAEIRVFGGSAPLSRALWSQCRYRMVAGQR